MIFEALARAAIGILIAGVVVVIGKVIGIALGAAHMRRLHREDEERARRLRSAEAEEEQKRFMRGLAVAVLAALLVGACGSFRSICATGEDFVGGACVCRAGHVPDSDGRGCHVPDAAPTTTTTTSTSSTTTTTTTTSTTLPAPPPSPSPAPTPCPSMPPELVSVARGLAPSSCERPGENGRCFREGQGGEDVPWQTDDEDACWPAQTVAAQAGRRPFLLGGLALYCEPGYLSDPDDTARGCFDAYGRRAKWDGGRWVEQKLPDRFSGWWLGVCPPRVMRPCVTPTPQPTAPPPAPGPDTFVCSLPRMRNCGEDEPRGPRQWGCCSQDETREVFKASVIAAQKRVAILRPDLFASPDHIKPFMDEAYTEAVARVLREEFRLCAVSGGPHDEVGVKSENGWSEQYDLVRGSDNFTHVFQAVGCRPARF